MLELFQHRLDVLHTQLDVCHGRARANLQHLITLCHLIVQTGNLLGFGNVVRECSRFDRVQLLFNRARVGAQVGARAQRLLHDIVVQFGHCTHSARAPHVHSRCPLAVLPVPARVRPPVACIRQSFTACLCSCRYELHSFMQVPQDMSRTKFCRIDVE